MITKNVSIDLPIPYARNPRKNTAAIDYVASSIKEFGFQQPIVIDKDNVVIVGHTRLLAAKKLGLKEVPIIIAEGLTPQQIKAYRIADNKTADYSEFDNELLVLELEELKEAKYDLSNTAFEEFELNQIIKTDYEVVENYKDEWDENAPIFNNLDETSFRHIIVHFRSNEDVIDFGQLINQKLTDKSRSIWFPPEENKDHRSHIFIEGGDENE